MRSALVISVACAVVVRLSNAFTCPSTSLAVNSRPSRKVCSRTVFLSRPIGEDEFSPSLKFMSDVVPKEESTISTRQRIRTVGLRAWERMDTLKAAGLYGDGMVPMRSGFKANVGLLVAAFMFKWYRARFINKIPVWDRQPQWNMVITSPEQEKELHAYSCKNCGATIFIARHREWFFQGGNTECTNCGAKGADNFVEIRNEIINSIDDDYFDYESPLDFVSAAERRKLVKQAGGDEELAKKLAIENAMKNDKEQITGVETVNSAQPEKKKKKKKKKRAEEGSTAKKVEDGSTPNKEKVVSKKESDDIFDILDMDL